MSNCVLNGAFAQVDFCTAPRKRTQTALTHRQQVRKWDNNKCEPHQSGRRNNNNNGDGGDGRCQTAASRQDQSSLIEMDRISFVAKILY